MRNKAVHRYTTNETVYFVDFFPVLEDRDAVGHGSESGSGRRRSNMLRFKVLCFHLESSMVNTQRSNRHPSLRRAKDSRRAFTFLSPRKVDVLPKIRGICSTKARNIIYKQKQRRRWTREKRNVKTTDAHGSFQSTSKYIPMNIRQPLALEACLKEEVEKHAAFSSILETPTGGNLTSRYMHDAMAPIYNSHSDSSIQRTGSRLPTSEQSRSPLSHTLREEIDPRKTFKMTHGEMGRQEGKRGEGGGEVEVISFTRGRCCYAVFQAR